MRGINVFRGLLLCCCFFPFLSAGADDSCHDPTATLIWETSPVHSDGVLLARRLEAHGFQIVCMRRSIEEHLFESQKGAAWVKTDHRVFEAWFLPSGQSFEKLAIKEAVQGNQRYLYSFSGLSHVPPTFDSSQSIAFIKNGNVLLKIWGNPALAEQLRPAFSISR